LLASSAACLREFRPYDDSVDFSLCHGLRKETAVAAGDHIVAPGGRGKLPTNVVRIRSVLLFVASSCLKTAQRHGWLPETIRTISAMA